MNFREQMLNATAPTEAIRESVARAEGFEQSPLRGPDWGRSFGRLAVFLADRLYNRETHPETWQVTRDEILSGLLAAGMEGLL